MLFQRDPVHAKQNPDGPGLVAAEKFMPEILFVAKLARKRKYAAARLLRTEIVRFVVQDLRNRGYGKAATA